MAERQACDPAATRNHVAFLRTDTIELTLDGDQFNWVSTEPVIPLSRLPQGTTQTLADCPAVWHAEVGGSNAARLTASPAGR
jgi:hypothetical protein